MKPVYKTDADPDYKPIPNNLDIVMLRRFLFNFGKVYNDDDRSCISFKFDFSSRIKQYWFAYCFPWSYEQNQVIFIFTFRNKIN